MIYTLSANTHFANKGKNWHFVTNFDDKMQILALLAKYGIGKIWWTETGTKSLKYNILPKNKLIMLNLNDKIEKIFPKFFTNFKEKNGNFNRFGQRKAPQNAKFASK